MILSAANGTGNTKVYKKYQTIVLNDALKKWTIKERKWI